MPKFLINFVSFFNTPYIKNRKTFFITEKCFVFILIAQWQSVRSESTFEHIHKLAVKCQISRPLSSHINTFILSKRLLIFILPQIVDIAAISGAVITVSPEYPEISR